MITLYFRQNSKEGRALKERMDDLSLAYESRELQAGEQPDSLPEDTSLPAIKENRTIVTGQDNLNAYLRELEKELSFSRSISADACYVDPDSGKLC